MHLLSLSTQGLSYFNPFRKYSKRVLLIRPDKLGDFLISLSSCHQACAYYHSKGYTISLAVSPDLAELAKQCPLFDEIIICDLNAMSQSRSYRLSIYRKLYSLHPEITINLLMVLKHTVLSDYMACMSKAKITAHASYPIKEAPNIIFPDTFNWIERWESLYNCAITYDTEKSLLENETSLMGKACGVVFTPKLFNLDFLSLPDSQLPKNYYLVSPGGQSRIPWPAERYAKLIDLISKSSQS